MAKSNLAAGLDDHEGIHFPREEILENFKETIESFSSVEDDINELFEYIYKNKIRLHENWKIFQRKINEMMKQNEKTQADPTQSNLGAERKIPHEKILKNIQETAGSFFNVEDDINGLFDYLYKSKTRLHRDWKTLQRKINELMKQSEKSQVDPTQDQKIEQYENEISERKQEIDLLKTQVSDSQLTINDLNGKILQHSSEKDKQEDDHKRKLKLAQQQIETLKTQLNESQLRIENQNEKLQDYEKREKEKGENSDRILNEYKQENYSLKVKLRDSLIIIKEKKEELQQYEKREMSKEENADNRIVKVDKQEIDSLKIKLRDSLLIIKALKAKLCHYTREKGKEENADKGIVKEDKQDSLKVYRSQSLKDQNEKLQQYEKRGEEKEENSDNSDQSMEAWVKVRSGIDYDSITDEKIRIELEMNKTQLEGDDKAQSKNLQKSERKEHGEKSYMDMKFCESVQMMDHFYEQQWIETHISLNEGRFFESDRIYDILFYTLWEAYQFICKMLDQQVKKLFENLCLLFGNVPQTSEHEIPVKVEDSLKEAILSFKPQEKDKMFKEELFKKFSVDAGKYLKEFLKFNTYIDEGLKLIRALVLKNRNWYLKSHKIGEELDEKFFKVWSGPPENCNVKKVIFPVLLSSEDGKPVVIRKGMVTTVPKE